MLLLMIMIQKIIEEILDYNKNAQKNVLLASKVDEGKSVPKKTIVERNIEDSVKLRRRRRRRRRRKKHNELFKKYFSDYRSPSDMYKKLRETEGKKMRIKYI